MRNTIGDVRVRKAFLFLSLTIYSEQRWFEWCEWEDQLSSGFNWIPIGFLN